MCVESTEFHSYSALVLSMPGQKLPSSKPMKADQLNDSASDGLPRRRRTIAGIFSHMESTQLPMIDHSDSDDLWMSGLKKEKAPKKVQNKESTRTPSDPICAEDAHAVACDPIQPNDSVPDTTPSPCEDLADVQALAVTPACTPPDASAAAVPNTAPASPDAAVSHTEERAAVIVPQMHVQVTGPVLPHANVPKTNVQIAGPVHPNPIHVALMASVVATYREIIQHLRNAKESIEAIDRAARVLPPGMPIFANNQLDLFTLQLMLSRLETMFPP